MIITTKVKTNQKKFSIEKKGELWLISVTSLPEKNRANIEIVKELSRMYGSAKIIAGLKSNKKKIEVGKQI